ncbi:MAG TPA: protein translocase subunit SecF [bacterium]|nr:protein translocase subunit SecF [bacterium]
MINLNVIKNRKIWLSFSGILVALSIVAVLTWGLKFGIDFTGGSLLEVQFNGEKQLSAVEIREALQDLSLNSLIVQPTESNSIILRFKDDSEDIHQSVLEKIGSLAEIEELRYEAVGPSIGKELKSKSFNTIFLVLIIIVLYIALVFKKVSKPVSSWKYGIASIVALFHDIIIVLGVFAVLGKFFNTEINTPFIAAILTVLGYSINDTIIVFDRIRENLPKSSENFMNTINKSINQTLVRSINTSFTTILALLAIIIFGGSSIRDFVLALAVGIFIGTYSSIFVASPMLVWFDKRRK